jgi:hypothetical protein
LAPSREDVEYRIEGGMTRAARHSTDSGAIYDAVAFTIELFDSDAVVARITNHWRFRR